MPQFAIAHEGSCASTSRKVFSPAPNQNECSIATPRSSWAWTLGSHDVGKLTLPSCSAPCAGMVAPSAVMNASAGMEDFMGDVLDREVSAAGNEPATFDRHPDPVRAPT